MRLTVVGGGVVGLACALACRRDGLDVTVVDAGACGGDASRGNAGWIVPSLSTPRTARGALRELVRTALGRSPGGPTLHPWADRAAVLWLWRCLQRSTSACHHADALATLALSRDAVSGFEQLRAAGLEFESHADGLLYVGLRAASLRGFEQDVASLRAAGYTGSVEVLDGDEARAFEPVLSDRVDGAVLLADERHVRPETLTRGLVDALQAAGGAIREHTPVSGLRRARREWIVQASTGEWACDAVLVAAGVGSRHLLAGCGVPLLLIGAAGTSVTAQWSGRPPGRPLKLAETMVACSPFDGVVRLSGGYRVGLAETRVTDRHVGRVLRGAAPYLRDLHLTGERVEWTGTRPVSPDDIPIIGPVPGLPGLHVATGHGMLGVTLAQATATALADGMAGRVSWDALAPFRVDRPALRPQAVLWRGGARTSRMRRSST